jgi:putative membrane protein
MRLLLNWLLSALALLLVAYLIPGFVVSGMVSALLAALVIGVVNATLGLVLKVLTFPLTLITLGLFWFVINALMLELASWLVPGFEILGFGAAFLGAIVLALVNLLFRWALSPEARSQGPL